MRKPMLLLLSVSLLGLALPAVAQTNAGQTETARKPPCQRFEHCLQGVLNTPDPLQKVIYASEGIKLWDSKIPKRDLINLLALRGEALLRLHEQGGAEHLNLLEHAEADYRRFMSEDKKHWLPYAKLGRILELRQQIADARRHYDQAVKSDQPLSFYERAAFFVRQNTLQPALADLDKAIQKSKWLAEQERPLHPQQLGPIYLMRAEVNRLLNRAMAADLDLREACKLGLQHACESP